MYEQPDIVFASQYQLVISARKVLLRYCSELQPAHLLQPVEAFNNTSISHLLAHVANVYIHWVQHFALQEKTPYFDETQLRTAAALATAFERVNGLMQRFMQHFLHQWYNPITHPLPGKTQQSTATPLAVFTHVVTHEFHHKGQILTMSRLLGYTPPDADIIRG